MFLLVKFKDVLIDAGTNAPVKLFCPLPPPGAASGSEEKCDKKGRALENEVKEGGALKNEGIKVIN